MKVNGEKTSTEHRVRGYVRIERTWRKGDVVELDLPMPVETVRAHPKVTANLGRVALMRGPLVYCLESLDNGAAPDTFALVPRADFATESWPDRLGGIVAIRASASGEPSSGWGEGLYAATPKVSPTSHRIVAVPFYANGNRGPVEMAVWIPRTA